MYFLRLNPVATNKKIFIFGEVVNTENPFYGNYKIFLKDGIGYYNNEIENISIVNATDLNEIKLLKEAAIELIHYLFEE